MIDVGSITSLGVPCLMGPATSLLPVADSVAERQDAPGSNHCILDSRSMSVPPSEHDVRIIVADDHPVVSLALSDSLNEIPGFSVVATARSGLELITAIQTHPCRLIVTDFSMQSETKDEDGLRLIERLRRMFPQIPIVVFTMLTNSGILSQLRQIGVTGIVSKDEPIGDLVAICVRAMTEKGPILSASVSKRLGHNDVTMGASGGNRGLSPKELEVVRMFALGLSVTEIARRLHRSVATIGTQKQSAMRKLHIETNAELLRYADEQGFA